MKDASNHAEYCLECIRKHLDTAFINLGEIEQRLIYKPEPDKKVRLKIESIIADIEAAEQHALDNTQTTAEEKAVLGELTNAFRKTRKLLETTRLGYRDERILPIGGLTDIQLAKNLIDNHRSQVHFAIAEIGCGDCDSAEAQMGLVAMRKQLSKEVQPIESIEEITVVQITGRGLTQPDQTLMQEKVIEAAEKCEKEPEPDACVVEEAQDIQKFKIKRGDVVIPTTVQLIERINKEMKK